MLIGINGGYFPAICRVCFLNLTETALQFKTVFDTSEQLCQFLPRHFFFYFKTGMRQAGQLPLFSDNLWTGSFLASSSIVFFSN